MVKEKDFFQRPDLKTVARVMFAAPPPKGHQMGDHYFGTIPDKEPEPVAWTNQYKQSRIFYTSLGHQDDFQNESFRRMLINAVFWAMNKPVPTVK